MHKRVTFFAVLTLLFLLLLVLLFRRLGADPTAPRFIHAGTAPQVGSYQLLEYNATDERPFAGNKVWLYVSPAPNT